MSNSSRWNERGEEERRRLTSLPKKSKVLSTLINYRKRSYFKSKLKWICFFDYILWGHDESPAWKNNSQLIPELQGEIIGVSSEIESQFCQNFIENFEESSSVELQEEIRYYFSDMNLTANYKFHWFLKKNTQLETPFMKFNSDFELFLIIFQPIKLVVHPVYLRLFWYDSFSVFCSYNAIDGISEEIDEYF